MHPVDVKDVLEKANNSFRSIYVPAKCTRDPYGRSVQIDGSIKSIEPPCTGEALSQGESPYTCSSCCKQLREF